MCGVAGIVNLLGDEISPNTLKGMTDAISHRGPDGEGQWIENNVGIGHRRLAIIDLSSNANQPMISINKRFVLSFNGEIYNYLEIKELLLSEGINFVSKSDTEVVLYALAQWGKDALLKFNGMFSLCFWDREEKKLLLARDRYGIKPLYYARQGKYFYFASEQKSILSVNEFKSKLNKKSLFEYFTFQNIITENTLLEDINILQPGSFGEILLQDSSPSFSINSYWDYDFSSINKFSNSIEYSEEFDRLFHQAVKRQLVSDVEIGAYLSGGIDSGSITAIAKEEFTNFKNFTIGFDTSSVSGIEMAFDERKIAESMSSEFKTEHYQMVLKSGDMERCIKKLTYHLEEPRVGQSYPNFYAAKLAGKFVKVVLSGTGGDELFAGYPWRYFRGGSNINFKQFIQQYYISWQRLLNESEIKKLFSPIWSEVSDLSTLNIFEEVLKKSNNQLCTTEDFINNSLYFEAKTFLHGLFIVEDKLSMAHSLENRVPFMDNDLVDFAIKCPLKYKLNNFQKSIQIDENVIGKKSDIYFKKTNDGKQIVRKSMSKYIPKSIIGSSKQGFSSPDASWFKGESLEFVSNIINSNSSPIFNFFDKKTTQILFNEHISGKKNRRLFIWSIINFNEWLNQNF